jgi:hypothetical protein
MISVPMEGFEQNNAYKGSSQIQNKNKKILAQAQQSSKVGSQVQEIMSMRPQTDMNSIRQASQGFKDNNTSS